MSLSFIDKLQQRISLVASHLCVGLDPDPDRFPVGLSPDLAGTERFLNAIIDATASQAAAFKPNIAFFDALGDGGRPLLRRVLHRIPRDIPLVLDAKVGDIGNTAARYAHAFFSDLDVDAVTLNPLMGEDAIRPFLSYQGKTVFALCLTSNSGARDLQLQTLDNGRPLYEVIADLIRGWDGGKGRCGAVVGATRGESLQRIAELLPTQPLLVPGVGSQGGDLGAVCRYLIRERSPLVLINSSRAILYAGAGTDYAAAAAQAARDTRCRIQDALE